MLKGCVEFAKGCQECQVHTGIQHVPARELHSIVKPWANRAWALDLIGEIRPASSKIQKNILVGIDYFTKWIDAIPLVNVDQENVIEFIQKHIIYRMIYLTKSKCNLLCGGFSSTNPLMSSKCKLQDGHPTNH